MNGNSPGTADQFADRAMALLASTAFRVTLAVSMTLVVVLAVRLNPEPAPDRPAAIRDRPVEAPVTPPAGAYDY